MSPKAAPILYTVGAHISAASHNAKDLIRNTNYDLNIG